MAFLNKKKQGDVIITCMVIGEDRNIMHRSLLSTGTYLLDQKNLMAYDTVPECTTNFFRTAKNKTKYLGLTNLLYETMSRPFSFSTLDWVRLEHKEDQIKDSALSEGCSKAVQRIDLNDRFEKMWTLALIAVGGVVGLALIFAFQSGLVEKVLGK